MEDVILAVDVDVGDVIVLPAADESVLVTRVRFGRGGLIFTVTPADGDSPEEERLVTLTPKSASANAAATSPAKPPCNQTGPGGVMKACTCAERP